MISDDCLKVCDSGLICYKNIMSYIVHCSTGQDPLPTPLHLVTETDPTSEITFVLNEQEDILIISDVFSYYWNLVRNMHCGYFFMIATNSISWKCYIVSPLYDTSSICICVSLSLLIVSFWWQAGEIKWQVSKENDGRLNHIPWRPSVWDCCRLWFCLNGKLEKLQATVCISELKNGQKWYTSSQKLRIHLNSVSL